MTSFLFDIEDATGRVPPHVLAWVSEKARSAAQRLGLAGQVHVRIVDDARMSALHAAWFDDPSTTDVVTLDLLAGERSPHSRPTAEQIKSGFVWSMVPVDADIAVCADEAARHAGERGYPLERELLLCVVHGVMHCLGWNDESEAEAGAMHRAEDALLEAVGVGAVYAPGGSQEDQR